MENNYRYFPRLLLVKFIRLYQKTLSFDYGWFSFLFPHGYCRFHPTCSEYGIQAITKYGAVKGTIKASWRILRCHPWHKGGFDPMKSEGRSKKAEAIMFSYCLLLTS